MKTANVLMDVRLEISERYRVELKVFEVEAREKYPGGIKVSYVLFDSILRVPWLLVDNHAPYGLHVHEELPDNKDARRLLKTTDHLKALDEFWRLVKEFTGDKS